MLGALASGHPAVRHVSLIYGFTGTTSFAGIRAALDGAASASGALFGLVFVLAGLAFKISRGAVPHVDARRLRRRADAGDDVLRHARPRSPRIALTVRVALEALRHRRPTRGGRS